MAEPRPAASRLTAPVSAASGPAVVAVAASAGGITALSEVLGALPADFPVPVLVVQHLAQHRASIIAEVLDHRTVLPVKLAQQGERIVPGIVYVAPPDHHLLITEDGRVQLDVGEPVHFVRPAADQLFESVAKAYGPRALVCVLSGTGRDGAQGAAAVKAGGGLVIVENPESARFKGMPEAAVRAGAVDHILPLAEIGPALRGLTNLTGAQ
jgi:two-component system, chemotaxis family, protein-glutamate methylesterase/glutaminase